MRKEILIRASSDGPQLPRFGGSAFSRSFHAALRPRSMKTASPLDRGDSGVWPTTWCAVDPEPTGAPRLSLRDLGGSRELLAIHASSRFATHHKSINDLSARDHIVGNNVLLERMKPFAARSENCDGNAGLGQQRCIGPKRSRSPFDLFRQAGLRCFEEASHTRLVAIDLQRRA